MGRIEFGVKSSLNPLKSGEQISLLLSKPFVTVLWFGGSDSLSDRFEGKEQKERENQAKKKLEMEKEREIKQKNSKNQISMSLEQR